MQLPPEIQTQIEALTEGLSLCDLAKEREQLTHQYRSKDADSGLKKLIGDKQRLAYLAARLPATFAAVYQVLREALKRCGPVESLLDIGAGPGTVLLASQEAFYPLKKATLIERDKGFIDLGKKLTASIPVDKNWICQDFKNEINVPPHDLVVASYSLGELQEKDRFETVEKLWKLSNNILILIEPGTKSGFESLKKVRENLITHGGHLIAPCPHSLACPTDWCHFSARIERSSLHRRAKEATLNYEDEKFSYLIFSKNKIEPCHARIIRHPFKGSGFIKLQLCSKTGIEEKTITKKNKISFLDAKKLKWGDELK